MLLVGDLPEHRRFLNSRTLVFAKRRAVVIELVSLRRKQFERQMARQ